MSRSVGITGTRQFSCIHQGHELYGSDRSFAETVATIRGTFPTAEIDVVLPREGPLVGLLTESASRTLIEPVWVLRRRNLLRLAATCLLGLPLATLRAVQRTLASASAGIVARMAKTSTSCRFPPRPQTAHRETREAVRCQWADVIEIAVRKLDEAEKDERRS